MQEYNIKIIHRAEKRHLNVDAMSRLTKRNQKEISNEQQEEAIFITLPALIMRA